MTRDTATATEHATAILSLAAKADGLVEQLHSALAEIENHETAALKALGNPVPIDGQRRLGAFVISLLGKPAGSSQTASEVAARAWREFV